MSPYVVNQDSLCKTYDLCAISVCHPQLLYYVILISLIFLQNHYGGLGGGHCKYYVYYSIKYSLMYQQKVSNFVGPRHCLLQE
jgi:hypothetical protein